MSSKEKTDKMDKKDKRIKGCPDPDCERHIEHFKYKSTDQFCSLCGAQLVYVCAKCFDPIEDTEDKLRYCESCKPKQSRGSEDPQKPSKDKEQKAKEKEQKAKEKEEKKQEKEEKKEANRQEKEEKKAAKKQEQEQKKQEREEKKEALKQEKEAQKLEKKEQKEAVKAQKPQKEPGKGNDAFSKGVSVIKGKAPQIKEGAKKIARNPKVQRAALEVADIAKNRIRHRKTRRIVGVLIKAAKK